MERVCFYHAGCPDGFGAVWAVWRAWGDGGRYLPRGHDDTIRTDEYADALVTYVDIAPKNDELRDLADRAAQVVVLDHHVSSRDRFDDDLSLQRELEGSPHVVHFDLTRSGAVLAWEHWHDAPIPDLLRYVQDQDLWNWELPRSQEVNAALASYPRTFEVWNELAGRPIDSLADEGVPILRANRMEVERVVRDATPIRIGEREALAVNATQNRASVGHELALRKEFGDAWGCVYRVSGDRVSATLYSIGDFDVARIATEYGGGGHKNAAGFSLPLSLWLADFVR